MDNAHLDTEVERKKGLEVRPCTSLLHPGTLSTRVTIIARMYSQTDCLVIGRGSQPLLRRELSTRPHQISGIHTSAD